MEGKELGFEMMHLGINCEKEEAALSVAETLQRLFGFAYKTGNSSIFSENRRIEIMKNPGRGTNGHIAIGTTDLEAAESYLKKIGCGFIEESRVVREGKTAAIYLNFEIAGFAIHLLQKT